MNAKQFDLIGDLICSREPVRLAAKRVLIDGIRPSVAAREVGRSSSSVCNTVARFVAADEKIRDAYRVRTKDVMHRKDPD